MHKQELTEEQWLLLELGFSDAFELWEAINGSKDDSHALGKARDNLSHLWRHGLIRVLSGSWTGNDLAEVAASEVENVLAASAPWKYSTDKADEIFFFETTPKGEILIKESQ